MSEVKRCSVRVVDSGQVSSRSCDGKHVTEVDGELYCSVHNPKNAARREQKSRAHWGEVNRQMNAEADRIATLESENARLAAELRAIADADPKRWDPEMRSQFQEWAQSRARAALQTLVDGRKL